MRHFIDLKSNKQKNSLEIISYEYNNLANKIGDFDYYCYSQSYWVKYRMIKGRFVYSKKPHCEDSKGYKEWRNSIHGISGDHYTCCNDYESYLLSMISQE